MSDRTKRKPYLTTIGELKKALAGFPDDMPLAIDDHGEGWGLAPPYVAHGFKIFNEHYSGYVAEDDPRMVAGQLDRVKRLNRPVCVLKPSCGFH